jgi:AcrR family transcriptional regulator
MARPYELKRRAERQEETRQRIVDAAIELHSTIGPNATTVTQLAERAGVSRVTVYRHFPDEDALARACSGKYFAGHPFPDLAAWAAIEDPQERLSVALQETYRHHRATEAMMTRVLEDARDNPVMAPYHGFWAAAADTLVSGRPARGTARKLLRARVALALSFDTWRQLTREQGLSDRQALDVAECLTRDCPPREH